MRSLGRLARGLSALFWGLPAALIIGVETAKTDILRSFNVLPPLVAAAWLCFGLWQLGSFQRQERIWQRALDRAKLLAVVDFGLSPFLYWTNQVPDQPYFRLIVGLLAVSGLAFLSNVNLVLQRLSAMLPDENLRQETRHFTTLNHCLVVFILALGAGLYIAWRFPTLLPSSPAAFLMLLNLNGWWLITFLVLPPLAMTMALLWKIKEVIMESVFGAGR